MPRWLRIEVGPTEPAPERPSGPAGAPGPGAAGDAPAAAVMSSARGRTVNLGRVAMLAVVLVGGGLLLGLVARSGLTARVGLGSDGVGPLATVNGEAITTAHVDREVAIQKALQAQLGLQLDESPAALQAFRREVLDQLVDQVLLRQAAERAGLALSEDEASAQLPLLGQGLGIDVTALEQAVAAGGIDAAAFRRWAQDQLLAREFLQTDAARELNAASLRLRYPQLAGGVATLPVQPDQVAQALQQQAELRFFLGAGQPIAPVRVGEPAPDFTLRTVDGQTVSLSDFRGKPVMVNFWATWCGPCQVEMPLFRQAYTDHAGELVVLAVDVQEAPEDVRGFVKRNDLTFPVVLDRDGLVSTLYRVRGLPTTFFVDRDGIVVEAHRGALTTRASLAPLLAKILPGAPSP